MVDRASASGTKFHVQRFSKEFPSEAFRPLGRTQWEVSAVGFGGYRVDVEFETHRKALHAALRGGCNLIDTSTNYTDGNSERAVGAVLTSCLQEKLFGREEIVLVSKVGYVQGSNLDLVEAAKAEGRPYEDVVRFMDGCWHCIAPAFIEDQLTRALERLQVKALDVLLLHNPEYFLSDQRKQQSPLSLEERRQEYYRRIRAAFVQLEREVRKGRIQFYGASSNTFVRPAADAEASSLSLFWEMAQEAAEEVWGSREHHHFAVAQWPMNLFELGALEEPNCGENESLTPLAFAQEKNIGVLVNRPLNAIVGEGLVRLADYPATAPARALPELLSEVAALEQAWQQLLPPGMEQAKDWFLWGTKLKEIPLDKIPADQWSEIQNDMILPQIQNGFQVIQISENIPQSNALQTWMADYRLKTSEMLDAISYALSRDAQRTSEGIKAALQGQLPESWQGISLSQQAIAALTHTVGVSSVLVGMRRETYVTDTLNAMRLTGPSFTSSSFPRL